MTRFVDGLAALALQRNGIDVLPTRAQVALPARYAARADGPPWVDDDGPGTPNERLARSAVPPVDAAVDAGGWPTPAARGSDAATDRAGAPLAATPPSAVRARPDVVAAPLPPAAAQAGGTARPTLPDERAAKGPSIPTPAAVHAKPAPGGRSRDAATEAGTSASRAASPVPVATPDLSWPAVDAGARTAPRAPLRESTVAERSGARSDERPIVHVTIERIDVRAPAPAARQTPALVRTQPQPSVSLADYLRGKGRTGSSS